MKTVMGGEPIRFEGKGGRTLPGQMNWRRAYIEAFLDVRGSLLEDRRLGRPRWRLDRTRDNADDRPADTSGLARWSEARIDAYARREAARQIERAINIFNEQVAKEQAFAA